MKKFFFVGVLFFALLSFFLNRQTASSKETASFWDVQSIDTMKYSRDLSREKLHDALFDAVIEQQIRTIAQTGATHVAIATPYDDEFLPILQRWVNSARRHSLHVWFRGNWSGWEGWFSYPKIDRKIHILKTQAFILAHRDLFINGDIFTPCPECENGGPGDPRKTGDVQGHRDFLIEEYKSTKATFGKIGKNVQTNYASMNADVASLIMDEKTTGSMDGIVVIDHYVANINQFAIDIKNIAHRSKGKVILGEFGAPVPSIHGNMTEEQQAQFLTAVFDRLYVLPEVSGINYWVGTGGSTELWSAKGNARKAVEVLTRYYSPKNVKITILNSLYSPIHNASVTQGKRVWYTDSIGTAMLPIGANQAKFTVAKNGYKDKIIQIGQTGSISILLEKENPGFFYQLLEKLRSWMHF